MSEKSFQRSSYSTLYTQCAHTVFVVCAHVNHYTQQRTQQAFSLFGSHLAWPFQIWEVAEANENTGWSTKVQQENMKSPSHHLSDMVMKLESLEKNKRNIKTLSMEGKVSFPKSHPNVYEMFSLYQHHPPTCWRKQVWPWVKRDS